MSIQLWDFNKYYLTAQKVKKYTCFLSFLLIVLIVSSVYSYAGSLRIKVSPKRIKPGDAFIIKVKGVKDSIPPFASAAGTEFHFGDCGKGCSVAVGAMDIKTKPGAYTVKIKAGKKIRNVKIFVKKKRFPKLILTLPEEKVFLSPEDLDRVKEENEKLKEIFGTVSDKLWNGNFIIPLESDISTQFGTQRIMNGEWKSIHKGIDIKGEEGAEIHASNNGRVVLAEEMLLGGKTIILDHGQGIYTIYMHLSEFNAKPDYIISKGDVIGFVGSTGRSTGPHLHFGVKVMNINVNPVSLTKLEL